MKRFVLIFKILLPLFLLLAFFLPGCGEEEYVYSVEASKSTVFVGEEVTLAVRLVQHDDMGCSVDNRSSNFATVTPQANYFVWPSNGATVKGGVFVASKPGTYEVSWNLGVQRPSDHVYVPATIVVKETAAEDAAESTEAEETSTEPEETSAESETTSTETDANLHGLVPTKVTAHSHFKTDNPDSYADTYIECWNVGMLGGAQYGKATGSWVAIRDGKKFSEIIFEGTFTGGPNGDIELSAVSSSGNDAGSTAKIIIKLNDGEQMLAEDGRVLDINNPEAFKGWKD